MSWKPWASYALALISFAVVFKTQSMGLAALCLLISLIAMVYGTLVLVSSRIAGQSRDASQLLGPEEMARLRAQAQRKVADSEPAGDH
ncbi:MAG: hypothetical protein R3F04_14795 [Lysobacteraceae bacterium]